MLIFGVPTKVIACSVALTGFAIALVSGLSAGNRPVSVMVSALLSMAACYVMGLVVGGVAQHTVSTHVANHQKSIPVPKVDNSPRLVGEGPSPGRRG